ncbi:MAG: SprT-like domain-containing protein [Gallionellaceae bacterium]|nr:SprT-like domain-containing protein [Gallionellaceae bacterium]
MQTRPTEEAYAEFQQAYDLYNDTLFDGELPPCLITFQRQKKTFGYFSSMRFGRRDGLKSDEIALNPEYFAVVPMVEVLQTMAHEQTHLWQSHFGKPSRACYHNTEWADKMEAIGLMPSSTSRPGGKRVGQYMGDYVIPGGRFEVATADLLATGFMISWLDRYPVQLPSSMSAVEVSTATGAASSMQSLALPPAAMVVPTSNSQIASIIEKPRVDNRSNRSKYTCPSCALNAWGKPGLRIACVDCGVVLQERSE